MVITLPQDPFRHGQLERHDRTAWPRHEYQQEHNRMKPGMPYAIAAMLLLAQAGLTPARASRKRVATVHS